MANRNTWSQAINLGVFHDQKDIFRDNVPIEKGRRVHFPLKGNDCDDIENGHSLQALVKIGTSDLHDSIPRMKYTRIITAEKQTDGKFLFMCSCGFDFRYQGTCKHISMLLLHASDGECGG